MICSSLSHLDRSDPTSCLHDLSGKTTSDKMASLWPISVRFGSKSQLVQAF